MRYLIRLDDACERRNVDNWSCMEGILDRYNICPLVGIIPHCEDPEMDKYSEDNMFWETVSAWVKKGWLIALHGYNHVYITNEGGINPINKRSEFAGVSLEEQKKKIVNGVKIFRAHGYDPKIFFAPSHTFDSNTIEALRECSNIRIISDTIANRPYSLNGFTYIPQQSGVVRKIPLNTVTFCYHPNIMQEKDFARLDDFINENRRFFKNFEEMYTNRKKDVFDCVLRKIYFAKRGMSSY